MSLIVCKKCSGNHLTLKCGKETKPLLNMNSVKVNNMSQESNTSHGSNMKHGSNNIKQGSNMKHNFQSSNNTNNYFEKRKDVTVKLSNLPDDITQNELEGLMEEWGSIGRINISTFENKTGFINFHFKAEADYFIEAVDRTPFDNMIIRAEHIDSKY